MIYIVNNCFVHVHNGRKPCHDSKKGVILYDKETKIRIMTCIKEFNKKLKWNEFIFLSVIPQTSKEGIEIEKE